MKTTKEVKERKERFEEVSNLFNTIGTKVIDGVHVRFYKVGNYIVVVNEYDGIEIKEYNGTYRFGKPIMKIKI